MLSTLLACVFTRVSARASVTVYLCSYACVLMYDASIPYIVFCGMYFNRGKVKANHTDYTARPPNETNECERNLHS